jgi:hypothetical protein
MNTRARRFRGLLLTPLAAVAMLAIFAVAAQAKTPAAGYEQFTGCPTKAEKAEVTLCQHSTITGGHFQMGSKTVPISKPITLTAGFVSSTNLMYYTSEGGLSATKLEIPGGIVGLTGLDWLIKFLNADQLKVYAETQLAGTPKLTGVQLTLPIKVHLINPVLGPGCFVGSDTEPIDLHLVTGTTAPPPPNEPIKGKAPATKVDIKTGIVTSKEGIYVDNSFAAPAAKGCNLILGLIPVNIDAIVNLQSGLPSAAGTNETVQEFEAEQVVRTKVYPGE